MESKNKKGDIKNISKEFYNELINYKTYLAQAKKTKKIRETILTRALITNSKEKELELDDILENLEDD